MEGNTNRKSDTGANYIIITNLITLHRQQHEKKRKQFASLSGRADG